VNVLEIEVVLWMTFDGLEEALVVGAGWIKMGATSEGFFGEELVERWEVWVGGFVGVC
jgi:hypothetical protein